MSIRAVRNNNPGNIRIDSNWQGLMPRAQMNPEQAAETQFCVFLSPQWGFRAMAEIFHTYADKDGITTLRGAVARWAPPNENNTGAYLNDICNRVSWGPDAPYPFHDNAHCAALLKAFSTHEVGFWAFSDDDALDGAETAH
jgi:hypothetical protein